MSTTLRYSAGRKGKNSTRTIRRTIRVKVDGNSLRINKSFYMGSKANVPKKSSNYATVNIDTSNGTRRSHVSIS